jgi:serine protease Do
MLGIFARFHRPALAAVALSALALPSLSTTTLARGPDNIADMAEQVIDAVVNISTSQNVALRNSPDDLFRDFFDRRGGQGGQGGQGGPGAPGGRDGQRGENQNRDRGGGGNQNAPRRVNSLGSGFIIDAAGIVVTNNHVINEADEITVILNDGSRIKAELIGKDKETDLALLRIKSDKPLRAVKFGDSDRLRIGEWVVAIGNPFSFGGTVTAGIVSARNRDIGSGRYDNYIQTDAAINRGNSGGPLFNLEGDVVGVNTAIISPTGGSIGIGFAVPSKTAIGVIQQLRDFGETRRGWLGVRISQVPESKADELGIKPVRGALVGGVDDKGPAKPAGIMTGDVILKFDGKDIKDMRDLPRVVADTPVGKEVDVIIVRKGDGDAAPREETKKVTLGRLEEAEKLAAATPTTPVEPPSAVKKLLGLELSNINDELRKKYKIKDTVKGIVVTGVEAGSVGADRRLSVGDVIVAVTQENVVNPDDFQAKIDKLKRDGRKVAQLTVADSDGVERHIWVTLP